MQFIPIKTRVLTPPKDNLYSVFDEYLNDVQEGDVVVVTSKVVAIHEGRCVPIEGSDKGALVSCEADYIYQPPLRSRPLTIKFNALISGAGIDESNGLGYYTLLPKKPFESAKEIYLYLKKRFKLNSVGVIITDSHSLPFRYGAMSIGIGHCGFEPVESHVGRSDLFGRIMKFSKTNIADSISAACALVSGECDECQPIVVARGIPNLVYTGEDTRDALFVPFEEDLFKDLFKDFRKETQGLAF